MDAVHLKESYEFVLFGHSLTEDLARVYGIEDSNFRKKNGGIAIALSLHCHGGAKTLTFCNISVITEDIYLKLRICVFTIKRAIHTIKGDNSRFF